MYGDDGYSDDDYRCDYDDNHDDAVDVAAYIKGIATDIDVINVVTKTMVDVHDAEQYC